MHQSHWRHPLSLLVRLVPLHEKVRNRCQQLCDGSASESSSRWCPLPGVSFCHVTTADHFTADLLSEHVKQQKKDVKCLRVYSLQAFYVLSLLYTFAHDSFQFQSWFQRNGFDSLRSLPVELKKPQKNRGGSVEKSAAVNQRRSHFVLKLVNPGCSSSPSYSSFFLLP